MTTSEQFRAKLKAAYAHWHVTKAGSVDTWMALCDEHIKFGSLAEGRSRVEFTAALRGRDTLKAYFDGLTGGWTMIHFTVDRILVDGDTAVMIGSTAWINKATGKDVETPKVDVWRFNDAGKAIEFYEYYDTATMLAATMPG